MCVVVHTRLYLSLKGCAVDIPLLSEVALKIGHGKILEVVGGIRKDALEHRLILGGDGGGSDILEVNIPSSVHRVGSGLGVSIITGAPGAHVFT